MPTSYTVALLPSPQSLLFFCTAARMQPGRTILPYLDYIYRNVQPQRVGFSATLVMNRVSILAILVIDSTDLAVPASWTFSHFQLSADSLTRKKKYSVPAPQTINTGQSLHF